MKAAVAPSAVVEEVSRILRGRDASISEIVALTGERFSEAAIEQVLLDVADPLLTTVDKVDVFRRRFSERGPSTADRIAWVNTTWRFFGAWSTARKRPGRKAKSPRPA